MHLPSFPAPRNRVMMLFLQETDSPPALPLPFRSVSAPLIFVVGLFLSCFHLPVLHLIGPPETVTFCQSVSPIPCVMSPPPHKLRYTDQNILLVRSVVKHMPSAVLCGTCNMNSVTSACIIVWEKPS